ncbi:MAG: CRISPR-associated endonuclease Cas2 [Fusobacteriaceae bacterium]
MITNPSFIGMIIYDISVQNNKMRREYTTFRNKLLRKGYYQIQESVYVCKFKYKTTANLHLKELKRIAPKESNIRMITLTKAQFNLMETISGEKSFNEKILSEEKIILEL